MKPPKKERKKEWQGKSLAFSMVLMFTDCLEIFCERLSHIHTKWWWWILLDWQRWKDKVNTQSNNAILRLKADGWDFFMHFFYYYFSYARLILGCAFNSFRIEDFYVFDQGSKRRKLKSDYKWMLRTKDLLFMLMLFGMCDFWTQITDCIRSISFFLSPATDTDLTRIELQMWPIHFRS